MTADDDVPVARRLWRLLERYHGILYFAKESREEFAGIGMPLQMMYYLASRAAPMGPVTAGPVTAALYNFHPKMIQHFLGRAWSCAAPEAVLEARLSAMDRIVRRLGCLSEPGSDARMAEAAEITAHALDGAEQHGRPMFAANAGLPWPEEPHLALWHAATLVREHRGDGHATALLHEGIDGCEAHMLVVATGVVGREWLQYRGWNGKDCAAAEQRLRERGWMAEDGTLTELGLQARQRVEATTDRLASGIWRRLTDDQVQRLADLLAEPVAAIDRGGIYPGRYPPVG